jgi:hypothetical protein
MAKPTNFSTLLHITTWDASGSQMKPTNKAQLWNEIPRNLHRDVPNRICLYQDVGFEDCHKFENNSIKVIIKPNGLVKLTDGNGVIFGIGWRQSKCLVTWNSDIYTYVAHNMPEFTTETETLESPIWSTPWITLQHLPSKNNLRVISVHIQDSVQQFYLQNLCMEATNPEFANFGCVIGGNFNMTPAKMTWINNPSTLRVVGSMEKITDPNTKTRTDYVLINSKFEFLADTIRCFDVTTPTARSGVITTTNMKI